MKNRIRKLVAMIKQSDASLKDNLSDLDYKLYLMSPTSFFAEFEEITGHIEPNAEFDFAADEVVTGDTNFQHEFDYAADDETRGDTNFIHEFDYAGDDVTQSGNMPDIVPHDFVKSEQYNELDSRSVYNDSRRVLVVENEEELQAYINTPIIVNDEEEPTETIDWVTGTNEQYEDYASEAVTLQDNPEEFNENARLPSSLNAKFRTIGKVHETVSAKQSQLQDSNENAPWNVNYRANILKTIMPLLDAAKVILSQNTEEKNLKFYSQTGVRIPEIQKERLVQLIQNRFLKAFGRFTGEQWKAVILRYFSSFVFLINSTSVFRLSTTSKQQRRLNSPMTITTCREWSLSL